MTKLGLPLPSFALPCLAYLSALPCLALPVKFGGLPSSALPDLMLCLALTKVRQRRGRADENTDHGP